MHRSLMHRTIIAEHSQNRIIVFVDGTRPQYGPSGFTLEKEYVQRTELSTVPSWKYKSRVLCNPKVKYLLITVNFQ